MYLLYSWFQTFAVFWRLYAFFWVIPRSLNFIFRRFGTLCLFHLQRRIGISLWRWNRKSVPKRRHTKFRCRRITQKKAYNIVVIFSLIIVSTPNGKFWIVSVLKSLSDIILLNLHQVSADDPNPTFCWSGVYIMQTERTKTRILRILNVFGVLCALKMNPAHSRSSWSDCYFFKKDAHISISYIDSSV